MESYRRGLASATVLNLLSHAVGFLTLLLFAYYFGARSRTDIYLYATAAISLIAAWITSLNTSVLIPESMRLAAQEGEHRRMQFLNTFFYLYLLIAAALSAALLIAPTDAFQVLSRFSSTVIRENRSLFMLIAPLLFGEVATTHLNDILVSHRFFTIPMLGSLAQRLLQALLLILLHQPLGVASMAVGSLAAYALQITALVLLLRLRLGWQFSATAHAVPRMVLRNSAAALSGNAISTLAQLLPQYLLSGLGAGAVTAVSYATRVVNIPHNLLTTPVSSVTGIKLNEEYARGNQENMNRAFVRVACGLTMVLTPVAILLFVEGRDIIGILFERGAFDAAATHQASAVLRWLSLTLPLLAINTMVARTFMATQRIIPAFWYQNAQNLVLIFVTYFGIRVSGGVGYAVSQASFYLWNAVTLLPLMNVWFPSIAYPRVLGFLTRMAGIGTVSIILVWAAGLMWAPAPFISLIVTTVLIIGVFFVAGSISRYGQEWVGLARGLIHPGNRL